ncbi:MAG: hypothetical protein JNK85_24255, partial [Verrucomicrobiales bacterium]|nr:hypothetical protein [Verrucomicrobiales bacterium]
MSTSLPPRPDLEQLRAQAKELLRAFKSGDPAAIRRFQESLPTHEAKLADAQCVVAREYGFASWPKLKEHVESVLLESQDPLDLFKKAFEADDASLMRRLLARFPQMRAHVNEPVLGFDAPPITGVRSREMLDVLLEAGADLNAKSRWWAGGFGLLHHGDRAVAEYAIERGAVVDIHAAARLGKLDRVRDWVAKDPALVHARGGDGQTPLHFASTLEIAEFLVDHGADINALDVDHESTPAQYMVQDRPEIARFLVKRGCRTDVLLAAALGDVALVRRHLDEHPECIHTRVSPEFFPMSRHRAGGTIYQWTLGWFVSPHDVARKFGHREVEALLRERSPIEVRFVDACWAGDESVAREVERLEPGLAARLPLHYRRHVALAARNNNTKAVVAMLRVGFPVEITGQHQGTPLHWAAFHGNAEMTREILRHQPPLEALDADFKATPLGWAIHGSENGWYA